MIKKIVTILICLVLTGCYDYQEINDIAIVNGIGIDYKDKEYIISYEIINIKSSNEEQSNNDKKYVVSANGNDIVDAIINVENKIAKKLSYSHLEILLISNNIARYGINDITDYFIRNSIFTNNFYLVVSMHNNPYDILSYTSTSNQISSNTITNLLKTTNSTIVLDNKDTFDYKIANYINGIDMVIPNIKIDKEIILDGMAVFKDLKYNFKLDNYETQIYGLLKDKIKDNLITNDNGAIEISTNKIDISYDNKIIININIDGKIKKINNTNFNLKDNNYLNELEDSFINTIKNRIKSLINRTIKNDSDIFNFKSIINNNDWHKEFDINIKLHINKSGTLFEVLS